MKRVSVLFWLLLWSGAALIWAQPLLFPAPWDVARAFFDSLMTSDFWRRTALSFARIQLGFWPAYGAGIALGVTAAFHEKLFLFLDPPLHLLRAIPVASFVLLALFFVPTSALSTVVIFAIVFPLTYQNAVSGCTARDATLDEMARLFSFSRTTYLRHVLLPQSWEALEATWVNAYGLAWKSGVAAEVIAPTALSIGGALYDAKVLFDMPQVFSWTLWMVAVSAFSGGLFRVWFFKAMSCVAHPKAREALEAQPLASGPYVALQNVALCYDEHIVLSDFSLTLDAERLAVWGSSGQGKTTLLHLIAGLIAPSEGERRTSSDVRFSMVFQEDRLIDSLSVRENLRLVGASEDAITKALQDVGLAEAGDLLASACSGGMKRRVALLRALLYPADVLLFDEPTEGLDAVNRDRTIHVASERAKDFGALVIASHRTEEAKAWGITRSITLE